MVKQFYPRRKPEPPNVKGWKPHKKADAETYDNDWIFISSALDEYGLDPYEFRILAHVARRAKSSKKGSPEVCFASQSSMANICGINKRKVGQVLKTLCDAGILSVVRTGRTNRYTLQTSDKWARPEKLQEIRSQAQSKP